ncbi:putative cyanohydrin beta-glucosyltransferase [Dioscorea sansibarensis]
MTIAVEAALEFHISEVLLFWTTNEEDIVNGYLDKVIDWIPGMKNIRLKVIDWIPL